MKFNNNLYILEKHLNKSGNDFALAACYKIFGESAVRESDGTIKISNDYIKPIILEECDKDNAQYHYRIHNIALGNSHPDVYLRRIDSEKDNVEVKKESIFGFPDSDVLMVYDKSNDSCLYICNYSIDDIYEGPIVYHTEKFGNAQSLEQLEIWLIHNFSK